HQGSGNQCDPGADRHHQEHGDRSDVGHASGRQGRAGEAGQREGPGSPRQQASSCRRLKTVMSKKHSRHGSDSRKHVSARPDAAGAEVIMDSLPQGAYALLADYEQRSLAHDPGVPEQIEAPGLWRAIGFRVGEHHFVSGIDEISEILMSPPPVTSIPSTRSWLMGVANVRGNLIALVDLK